MIIDKLDQPTPTHHPPPFATRKAVIQRDCTFRRPYSLNADFIVIELFQNV